MDHALLQESGLWITGPAAVDDDDRVPPYLFQKRFTCKTAVEKAEITATALGCYSVWLNGQRISAGCFAPGYTQYDKRVLVHTYDVTDLLEDSGIQILQAELAGGWYAGRLGLTLKGNRYGEKRALLLELCLTYTDGTREVIGTDTSWRVSTNGPRRFAGFFDGETYDARLESLAKAHFLPAVIYRGNVPPSLEPGDILVRRHECLRPQRIFQSADGETIVDFGRNIAGIVQLGPFEGNAGQVIHVRHGELVQDGKLFTENLRTAKAELVYTCKEGEQTYSPEFTYMGFQYVSVAGMEVTEDNICAYEVYSDMQETGSFSCSDERLNQLQENILTSLKANFVDIPTDCPQRDERCGWTGDIAVFAETAAFNMDLSRFMKKWLRDVSLAQHENGLIPMIVPTNALGKKGDGIFGVAMNVEDAVWGDAAILVPWAIYQSNGDLALLNDQYESMKRWLRYEEHMASRIPFGDLQYLWITGFHFGDWLAPGESMLKNMAKAPWTSTAYFANSARIMSEVATLLGHTEDARQFRDLYEKICKAFQKLLVDRKGHIRNGFQSIWVLALQFGLLTKEQEETALEDLVADIRARDNHLATGFVGTNQLLFALSDHGRADVAYDLLLQETFPSWIYPIKCGATSMWERWDSLKPDGTVHTESSGNGNMVSFNHYAYGAIGNWLYTRLGGLQMTSPGYRTFRVQPMPGGDLTWAEVTHTSPFGEIRVKWTLEGSDFAMNVTVPECTEAELVLPNGTRETVPAGSYTKKCVID